MGGRKRREGRGGEGEEERGNTGVGHGRGVEGKDVVWRELKPAR